MKKIARRSRLPVLAVSVHIFEMSNEFETWNLSGCCDVVLLIHSKKTNRLIWVRQVPLLVERGFGVICVDLPGFGRHAVASMQNAHIAKYPAFLRRVLEQCGVEASRVHCVGLALGGFAALAWALQAAPKSLMLVCSPGGLMTDAIRKCKEDADQTDRDYHATRADFQAGKESLDHFLRDSEHSCRLTEDAFLYRQIARQNDPAIAEMNFKPWMEECAIQAPVRNLNCPVMVVAGEQDQSWSVNALRAVADELNAKFEIVSEAGHTPNFERPREFNDLLLRWIEPSCKNSSFALVIVDAQERFRDCLKSHGIENIRKLVNWARNQSPKVPIAWTQHHDPDPGGTTVSRRWGNDIIRDSHDWMLVSELAGLVDERCDCLVQEKRSYDSFWETNLDFWLRSRRVKTVVIAGAMTNLCCETACRSAFNRGFEVVFLSDANGTSDAKMHEASLLNMEFGFASVETTEDFMNRTKS